MSTFGSNLQLSAIDGTDGFQISGEDRVGYASGFVSSAGDVNGDGFDDLIVGAYRADPNGDDSGAAYVIFGKATAASAFDDTLTGSAGADTLSGLAGNDRLYGRGGDDRLIGGEGNDVLVAGTGTDLLIGGAGNDTYMTVGGDTITEGAGNGTDTLRSSANITLGANLENLVLTGSGNLSVTGNGAANVITGYAGGNRLSGAAGKDRLDGGTGADSLTGGSGRDLFVFSATLSAGNADRITDFRVVDDTIHLDDAVFAGLQRGALAGSAFVKKTSGTAADRSDRVIYESDTGKVFFDRDGTGSASKVLVATLDKNLAVTSADFFVI